MAQRRRAEAEGALTVTKSMSGSSRRHVAHLRRRPVKTGVRAKEECEGQSPSLDQAVSGSGLQELVKQQIETYWPSLPGLRGELEDFFADFSKALPFWRHSADLHPHWTFSASLRMTLPTIDLIERQHAYEVTCRLPEFAARDIRVVISTGCIAIIGERAEKTDRREEESYCSDYRYGAFHKSLSVPSDVDITRIETDFDKGVLCITMPKKTLSRRPTPSRPSRVRS